MKTRKWFWGIFFIAAAAIIIANQLGAFSGAGIQLVSLIITLLLIPIMVESLVHLQWFGVFFPLAFLSIIYAGPLGIQAATPWPVLIAALFLTIGFEIIFKSKKRFWKQAEKWKHWENWNYHEHGKEHCVRHASETTEQLDGENVLCDVTFGSSSKYLHSTELKNATIHCSFGSLKVYFDNAQLSPNGATANVECAFGSIKLFIPRAWHVVIDINTTLGGVDEKNGRCDASGPTLTLTGSISFSGVEIYYV